jgi:hypothetical protein
VPHDGPSKGPRQVYEYAVIRIVPRVEREEFVNVGVIVFSRTLRFLDVRMALDEARLLALHPGVDLAKVRAHLALIPQIVAGDGPFAQMDLGERFRWVAAPHSTTVQSSPIHTGLCHDPRTVLEHLFARMVGEMGNGEWKIEN